MPGRENRLALRRKASRISSTTLNVDVSQAAGKTRY